MPTGRPGPAWSVAAALGLAVGLAGCSGAASPDELSVVLVTLDTTRADRIGAFGGRGGLSPHIDRLAEQGAIFEDAVSQVPLTLPAHASMLTGRYPGTHGVRHNGIYHLRETETTLAERLAAVGFETAGFVAAFVLNRGFGLEQGFEVYDDVPGDRFEDGQDRIYTAERSADEVNGRVFAWLDGRPDPRRRFLLWVHYYDPHDPHQAPDKPGTELRGEGYDREISYMDACFGDLVDGLRKRGLLDRSLLFVSADHGESLGDHGELTHGVFLYNPVVHVPMFVRAPGLVRAGTRVGGTVELVDVAPTILDYLGLEPLAGAQGRSLRGRIEGREDGTGALAYAETIMPRLEFGWADLRMVRDGRFKYIDAPRPELYDLRNDPGETTDLAGNDTERVAEMSALLAAWTAQTSDPEAERGATRRLDPEEEAKLRSLGYLGGDYFKTGGAGTRTDPKDGIHEVRRLGVARDSLAEGDAAAALAGAEEVLRANPRNHQARTTKVLALIDLRRLAEAEEEALAALAAAETDEDVAGVLSARARGVLASVFRAAGKNDEAEAQYRRMLRDAPDNDLAAVQLARLLIDVGRFDEARELVDRVLAADERHGMALAARFALESRAGNREAALATAGALAATRAGDPPVLAEAGGMLAEAGRAAEAAACFEVALNQQKKLDPNLLIKLGIARFEAGQGAGAAEALRAAESLRPRDPRPPYFLGILALSDGNESDGRRMLDRALALNPGSASPRVALARWLGSKGRREEAIAVLEDALRIDPRDSSAADLLARARAAGSSR